MRVKLSRPERPEQWADVRGYEGIYQISTCGNIRSLLFRNNICSVPMVRLLKPYDNGGGYLVVSLRKESRRHSRYVHRLVADTFLDKKDGCEYINHIDRNKRNNTVDNLEWCTQKQNVNHSRHNLCRPKKICRRTNTGEKYISFSSRGYRVSIRQLGYDARFDSLDRAINKRDRIISQNHEYFGRVQK